MKRIISRALMGDRPLGVALLISVAATVAVCVPGAGARSQATAFCYVPNASFPCGKINSSGGSTSGSAYRNSNHEVGTTSGFGYRQVCYNGSACVGLLNSN